MLDKIKAAIAEHGVDNIRFVIPMQRIQGLAFLGLPIGVTDSSQKAVLKVCKINEERYRIRDNYKIELEAVDKDDPDNYFGKKSFYQSDLNSMMKSNPEEYRFFILMSCDRYRELIRLWRTDNKNQRLGQYLINQMEPAVINPAIFYETDKAVALRMFCEQYVRSEFVE